jgi:hypothetical protein
MGQTGLIKNRKYRPVFMDRWIHVVSQYETDHHCASTSTKLRFTAYLIKKDLVIGSGEPKRKCYYTDAPIRRWFLRGLHFCRERTS